MDVVAVAAPLIPSTAIYRQANKIDDAIDFIKGVEKATDAAKGAEKVADKAGDFEKTYQTYTRTNPETGQVYSGRTSGTGEPQANVSRRDSGHHLNEEGFDPAATDKSSTNPEAIRGREQQLIDLYGGAQSQGGRSANKIRAVSLQNTKLVDYMKAATQEFK